jgi:hypothetical protein
MDLQLRELERQASTDPEALHRLEHMRRKLRSVSIVVLMRAWWTRCYWGATSRNRTYSMSRQERTSSSWRCVMSRNSTYACSRSGKLINSRSGQGKQAPWISS